jgi:hypothetical protein
VRAAVRLHSGRPAEALQARYQAADEAGQGARHTEDLAAALRADRPAGAVDSSTGGLAAAQAAMRGASQRLTRARAPAQSPPAASQSTRAAAVAMHKAASMATCRSISAESNDGPRFNFEKLFLEREHPRGVVRLSWCNGRVERRVAIVANASNRYHKTQDEGAMNGGCWIFSLGCQGAKRSAERSANRLPLYPQRC